jgi:hypothetical protein
LACPSDDGMVRLVTPREEGYWAAVVQAPAASASTGAHKAAATGG